MEQPERSTSFTAPLIALVTIIALILLGIATVISAIGEDMMTFILFIAMVCLCVWIAIKFIFWVWEKATAIHLNNQRAKVLNRLVTPDFNGLLPVAADLLLTEAGSSNAMKNQALFQWSKKIEPNQVPNSISYAPHVILKGEGKLLEEQGTTALATLNLDSLSQLWKSHQLPSNGFLMGYDLDTNEPINADWKQLYSALLGGKSGAGKSTLIRSVLAQSALQGGRFAVIDPHYASGEESLGASLQPLNKLLMCDVASDGKQIVDTLNYVSSIGKNRLAGKDTDRTPLILVVDETTALLQRSGIAPLLVAALGQIAQETRKVGVYSLCIGQDFNGRFFDTTVRNAFVSMLSCRTRKDVARVQSGNLEFGRLAETLQIGQCVWQMPSGEMHRIAIPNCTQQDLEVIATSISTEKGPNVWKVKNDALPPVEATSIPTSIPTSTLTTNLLETDVMEVPVEVTMEVPSAKAMQVKQMLIDGKTQNDILKELWGLSNLSGRRYQTAASELRIVISQLMKGV